MARYDRGWQGSGFRGPGGMSGFLPEGPVGPGYRERPGYANAPNTARGRGGPQTPAAERDEAIRAAVRRTLFEDTWLDARDIDIEVEDAVVTLRGAVRSHLEARYAWDDAWETGGVRGVISQLEVREQPDRR